MTGGREGERSEEEGDEDQREKMTGGLYTSAVLFVFCCKPPDGIRCESFSVFSHTDVVISFRSSTSPSVNHAPPSWEVVTWFTLPGLPNGNSHAFPIEVSHTRQSPVSRAGGWVFPNHFPVVIFLLCLTWPNLSPLVTRTVRCCSSVLG